MDNNNNNLFPGQDHTLPNTAPGNYTILQAIAGQPHLVTKFHLQEHFEAYMQEILFLKHTASQIIAQWPNPRENLADQESGENIHGFLLQYDGIHTNWGEYQITCDIKNMAQEF